MTVSQKIANFDGKYVLHHLYGSLKQNIQDYETSIPLGFLFIDHVIAIANYNNHQSSMIL